MVPGLVMSRVAMNIDTQTATGKAKGGLTGAGFSDYAFVSKECPEHFLDIRASIRLSLVDP